MPWVNAVLLLLIVGLIAFGLLWDPSAPPTPPTKPGPGAKRPSSPPVASTGHRSATQGEPEAGYEWVGGIKRPITDRKPLRAPSDPKAKPPDKTPKPDDEEGYGLTPAIDLSKSNPQIESAVAAIKQPGRFPERLSPVIQPNAFDIDAYRQDPKAYLDVAEPGRVFQPAQPGAGVSQIRRRSPIDPQVVQGESVALRVKSVPNMPVTFTSFDLGQFENQLTSMTVEANAQGMAEVKFFGTPGTINNVNILAASPVASGQVKFVVNVTKAVPGPTVGDSP